MNIITKMEYFSGEIRPHRIKFLIVGLVAFIPLFTLIIQPLLQGIEPEEESMPLLFLAAIIFMWCFGLLLYSFEPRSNANGRISRVVPTLSNIWRWYRAVFFAVWFVFLSIFTVVVPIALLTVNK